MIKILYRKKSPKFGISIIFSNSIVIKNKYLIIIISTKIIVFDIIKGEKQLVSSSPGNTINMLILEIFIIGVQ